MPLRFGIIGAARVAPKALIQPARQVPEVEVAAVAARDQNRARRFAIDHGIPRALPSYDAVLHQSDIDAVYVALPNSLHCEWSIAALRAGKHVLCEKPIAANATEVQRMADVAAETGLVLAEAFHYRYHPLASRIRELLLSGAIGRLTHLEARFCIPMASPNIRLEWSLGGGATMDLGCYPLNMIRHFSGLTARVRAAKARVGLPNIDLSMAADLELAGGITARMFCSMAPDTLIEAFFEAYGERGHLHVTNPVSPHIGHVLTVRIDGHETRESVPGEATFVHQLCAFVSAIRNNKPIATNAAEGVINMGLIDDVYRAAGLPPRGL